MYVKLNNGAVSEFPYSLGQLKAEHPNTSFPAEPTAQCLAEYEVFSVVRTPAPVIDSRTHQLTQGVELIDGKWTQVWTSVQLPENEAGANIRNERNRRLADCDWTQLGDSPLDADGKLAWQLYRETLRMVPQQPDFPWDVQWPPVPGSN